MDPLLGLCARTESTPLQRELLAAACQSYMHWDSLLIRAEEHGMGPLLFRHLAVLKEMVPASLLRGLRFLSIRHQQADRILTSTLRLILQALEAENIPVLVLKGAALCRLVYPEAGLRPMRDIDLLFSADEVHRAHRLLQNIGFQASAGKLPDDFLHLASLHRQVDGMEVCVELHHALFPDDPPYYRQLSFPDLLRNAVSFDLEGVAARSLADEEMLWHVYQHGFRAPLTYEPYRLISAADVISIVEQKAGTLNWERIKSRYPLLYKALPAFHYITPWSERVLEKLQFQEKKVPAGVGEFYTGWPRISLDKQGKSGLLAIARRTLVPGSWWMMLYYGAGRGVPLIRARMVEHPQHILRWMKIRCMLARRKGKPSEGRQGKVS